MNASTEYANVQRSEDNEDLDLPCLGSKKSCVILPMLNRLAHTGTQLVALGTVLMAKRPYQVHTV